jgi:hypothetical protein
MRSTLHGKSIPATLHRITKTLAAIVAVGVLNSSLAIAKPPPLPLDPVKLKQTLMSRGIGKGVKVSESDGTRVTGILTGIQDDTFELTPRNTTQLTRIAYTQVTSIHNDGSHTGSTAAKIGGGIAIGAGALVLVFVVATLFALHGG